MKRWGNIENKIIPVIFFTAILGIWQLIVDQSLVERYTLPSPTDVGSELITSLPYFLPHIWVTLQEAFIGFAMAIIFALLLAILMDNVVIFKKALYPLIVVSQTVPIIALAPLFAIWFGWGKLPKILIVNLVCFFPILVSLLHGLESVDKDMLNLLKSMGATRIQIFKLVKFPSALVSFFSGLRIAATYSIMGAVIGEWLGGSAGLGIIMLRVKHSFALDKFFAVIVIIVLLSITLFKFIDVLQHRLMPWGKELENNQ